MKPRDRTGPACWKWLCAIVLLFAAGAACSLGAPPATVPTPNSTATSIPATNTATKTSTSVPTDTATPTETRAPTKTPTATLNRTATAEVRATQAAEDMLVEIQKVLKQIGVPTENGNLAWFQEEPIEVSIDQYRNGSLVDPELNYADFVLKTDVTWDSTGGLAGCGIIFRSEPNFEMGEQYVFLMQRLSGLPLWDIERYQYGQLKSVLTGRAKANQAIHEEQGSTNEIILVAQGNLITVYANQIRLSRVNDSRLSEGALAFVAFQNSGETTCQFDNSWVWEIQ